jgi:hypothetical protein
VSVCQSNVVIVVIVGLVKPRDTEQSERLRKCDDDLADRLDQLGLLTRSEPSQERLYIEKTVRIRFPGRNIARYRT